MLSLDSKQLYHHTSVCRYVVNKNEQGFMNFGGVIVGYNAEIDGREFWEIASARHGTDKTQSRARSGWQELYSYY